MGMIYMDYMAVIIAAFLFLVLGVFWFSDIMFKKQYREARGITKKEMSGGWQKWLGTVVIAYIVSYSLAFLQSLLGVVSVIEGVYVGLGLFVGFVLPPFLICLMWTNYSCKVFFIEAGFWLVAIVIMSGFLGA